MKREIRFVVVVGALVGAFAMGKASGQEEGEKKVAEDPMAAWLEIGKPGPEHEHMKKAVGDWTCEVKSWSEPGAEPTVSKATTTFSMSLDGRYLVQTYSGEFMGSPFTGLGYTAYNRANKRYESIWMDSMSTGIMFMTGEEIQAGEVWEYKGSFFGPGGVEVKSRTLLKEAGDNERTMENYYDFGGGEMKSMEMVYRRAE